MVKHPVSTKAQLQANSYFSKREQLSVENGRALLQNHEGLCYDSPIRDAKGSRQHPYLPLLELLN